MNALTCSTGWRTAQRILAVRLDNLGDVLMTTPALRALRDAVPGRHVTLLTSRAGATLAPFLPDVDNVMALPVPWMPGDRHAPDGEEEIVSALRRRAFDAAVIFTAYSQSPLPAALTCWQAGIPLRLAHCRENPYQLLTDWVPDPEPHAVMRHEVRRQLDLVAAVGCRVADERLSFRIRAEDSATAMAKLRCAGVDVERPWILLHPGASAPSRRYPTEHFAAVAELLSRVSDHQLVITGAPNEIDIADAVRRQARVACFLLAGELLLGELAAAIAAAALLIANNTGPVHIAAALGTPIVDLYALTNPQHAPWHVPSRVLYHDVPCRFCYRSVCPQGHHACLRLLDPERVASAARELLDQHAERSAPPLLTPRVAAAEG
jgi:lipopolysaccharide heptosyltransferase II